MRLFFDYLSLKVILSQNCERFLFRKRENGANNFYQKFQLNGFAIYLEGKVWFELVYPREELLFL